MVQSEIETELNCRMKTKYLFSLKQHFTQRDYDFLLSFKSGVPDWALSPDANVAKLPAVKWKLININNMAVAKKVQAIEKLTRVLDSWL